MSVASSEQNYKIAKGLYQDISDDFYEIENNREQDDEYLIDQTLEDIKRLNRHINRINMEDLESEYDQEVLDVLDNNIDTFREASYYIERALMSMKLFDKIHPVLKEYMSQVKWESIGDTQDEAEMKFGRFLTSEANYQQYKTIIWNIVKGTMNKKQFAKLFDQISSRLAKPTVKREKQRNPIPPEMYPDKERKEWEEQIEKRRKAGVPDKISKFDDLGEEFISLEEFKKLLS